MQGCLQSPQTKRDNLGSGVDVAQTVEIFLPCEGWGLWGRREKRKRKDTVFHHWKSQDLLSTKLISTTRNCWYLARTEPRLLPSTILPL